METEYKNIENEGTTSWTPSLTQVLVVLTIWTSYLNTGLGMGTPTVAVPRLRFEANSTAAVSPEMASSLTSVFGFVGPIGIIAIIPIAHFFGRKFTIAIVSTSTLISSAIVFFSKSAVHLLISQLILGLSSSAQCSVYLITLTEYSSPKYRGVFLTFKAATYFWGIWIANAIGIFTHYRYIGLLGAFCATYSLIISLIIPESPYWLAFKGRYDECAKAHRWLKGVDEDSEKELGVLINTQKTKILKKDSIKSMKQNFRSCLMAFKEPDIYKPLLLAFLITALYNFSGKLVWAVYAVEMMKKVTTNPSTVNMGVLIIDGFTLTGMYVGCGLSKILKRRTLLLTTSAAGTLFLFAMAIYLYLIKCSVLPANDYIILVLLVGYSVSISCGPTIFSTSIPAELLPIRFRSYCVFIYSVFSLLLLSITLKVSPYLFNWAGFQGAYLFFGICSTIFYILTFKYLPETKDRTLHEIAEIFKAKREISSKEIKLLPDNKC